MKIDLKKLTIETLPTVSTLQETLMLDTPRLIYQAIEELGMTIPSLPDTVLNENQMLAINEYLASPNAEPFTKKFRINHLAKNLNVTATRIFEAIADLKLNISHNPATGMNVNQSLAISNWIFNNRPEMVDDAQVHVVDEPVDNTYAASKFVTRTQKQGLIEMFNIKLDRSTIDTLVREMLASNSQELGMFASKLQTIVAEKSTYNNPWFN